MNQILSPSSGCVKPMLDPIPRLNSRFAQPMPGPVLSSNSGFVRPGLDQVLGYDSRPILGLPNPWRAQSLVQTPGLRLTNPCQTQSIVQTTIPRLGIVQGRTTFLPKPCRTKFSVDLCVAVLRILLTTSKKILKSTIHLQNSKVFSLPEKKELWIFSNKHYQKEWSVTIGASSIQIKSSE